MTSKIKDFLHEFDVGARESKALISIFALAQATIFSGVHPAWTKHGFHTGWWLRGYYSFSQPKSIISNHQTKVLIMLIASTDF